MSKDVRRVGSSTSIEQDPVPPGMTLDRQRRFSRGKSLAEKELCHFVSVIAIPIQTSRGSRKAPTNSGDLQVVIEESSGTGVLILPLTKGASRWGQYNE